MDTQTNEYISGLSQLEMLNADGNSFGLIHTSELDKSDINYYQRLSLEKSKKVGADAVYFRNFPDLNRPSKPQLYIFDFTTKEQDVVEIHKNVWSSTEVRLYLVITKSQIKFFNSSKPVEQTKSGNLQVSPFETLKIAGDAPKHTLKHKILEWEQKNIFYGAFLVVGDSMTCDDQNKAIPNGAKVLAYQLQIDFESGSYSWFEIPTGKPLLIMGATSKGNDFCLCKTIFFLDLVNNMVSLRSYNPNYPNILY